ncbi:MAG TPA: NAD(P)-dependent oxidoreductase [Bacteroidales bacterium]|nr:NAD(P)-dependent oxidoreductase [Bacteroidales bacterium]
MKILITGNLGYVGSELVKLLRKNYPDAQLIGFDIGYFAKHITNRNAAPEIYLDNQYYGDVRKFPEWLLEGVDAVVQLAAISNDPIGNKFEEITLDINYKSVIDIAKKAKKAGVKKMIFASSCSVYGFAEESARTEESSVNPLTAYARSKVFAERDLQPLADDKFTVTCLRFATACGMSDRLRLDLVLNDFVAGAISSGEINIMSDGTPWRPLINVRDMGRAIIWGIERKASNGGNYLVINTGSNVWNYQVKELAYAINKILPETQVSINKDAQPDKRSYRVSFDKFEKLAAGFTPVYSLEQSINDLVDGLKKIDFNDKNYRQSRLIRLYVVNELLDQQIVNNQLELIK